jgi:tRNA1Val (adenine37-N6)-methyltransferase
MGNEYFQFRQFRVEQRLCAMKVGTDGTLLGAWAQGGETILDIGTGTGLIALMMAQRYPQAQLTAIDIEPSACQQAQENVLQSPFASRIEVAEGDIARYEHAPFDAIVSNPPYFERSLECPDEKRTQARHTSSLSYVVLMQRAFRLLGDEGCFSLVIPADCRSQLEAQAVLTGFFKTRECAVKTTPRKQPRRYLLEFRKHPADSLEKTEGIIETSPNVRSAWYQELTQDFYL